MKNKSIKKRQIFLLILMLGTLIFLASFTYLSINHAIKLSKDIASSKFKEVVNNETTKVLNIQTQWFAETLKGKSRSCQITLLEAPNNPLLINFERGIYSIVINKNGEIIAHKSYVAVIKLLVDKKTMEDIIVVFDYMIKNNETHHPLHRSEYKKHDFELFLSPIPHTSYYHCIILDRNKLEKSISTNTKKLREYFNNSITKTIIIILIIVIVYVIISIFVIKQTIQLEKMIHDNNTKLEKNNTILEVEVNIRKKIENELKEANDKLKQLSLLDGLTGIANRRAFDTNLEKECKRNAREKNHLSLVLLDIDFFKKYNDHYGHQEGDLCIYKIASVLEKNCHRPADIAARYGGEEFAAILPETDEKGAIEVAEKIMAGIASEKIPHEKSAIAQFVTVSIGIAVFNPGEALQTGELLKKADFALYRAKEKGRNQIYLFDSF